VYKCFLLRLTAVIALIFPSISTANSIFVAYELGEMTFNDFKNFAGEIGYNFENNHSVRFSFMNVALSEKHLSSSSVLAVQGGNVEGLWYGVDIYYDYPIWNRFSISPAIGYHDTEYTHVLLGESVAYGTATAGLALAYLGDDFLGINALYWRLTATYNHRFSPLGEKPLGDSTVSGDSYDFYPQLFIGYAFN